MLRLNANEIVPEEVAANTYIVRAGDTACQIAEKFSMKCRDLITLNKLNASADIFRGQRLKLSEQSTQTRNANAERVDQSSLEQYQYFFTHENFYVITRYNHSVLYAMAVNDLSVAVQQEKTRQDRTRSVSNSTNYNKAYIPK